MALVKRNDNFYWYTQDTYVKISGFLTREIWKDENWKLYSLEAIIDFYTNESKINHFSQITKKFDWLRLEELNFETAYNKLKQEDGFKDYIDLQPNPII